tara:strand:- start:388 stop:669 length:282 start_codon:yes stop_codon:yes gene_type:complete
LAKTLNSSIFQFLYGTIGSCGAPPFVFCVFKFQFLYGTIGRSERVKNTVKRYLFQFLYGTIGRELAQGNQFGSGSISIPVWYDWKKKLRYTSL